MARHRLGVLQAAVPIIGCEIRSSGMNLKGKIGGNSEKEKKTQMKEIKNKIRRKEGKKKANIIE